MRLLVEACSRLDKIDDQKLTPLRVALSTRHFDVACLLIGARAGINDAAALREAFESGNLEIARSLLQAGLDVDKPDSDGRVPLYWVSQRGHTEILKLLLGARACVNAPDSTANTPLIWAADWGKLEIVQMLILAAADIQKATATGITALHKAFCNHRLDIAWSLIEARASYSSRRGSHQRPPLLVATEQADLQVARWLLNAGADPDAVDSLCRTALCAALQMQVPENLKMVQLLIESKASVNWKLDAEGSMPLHFTSQAGQLNFVRLLLEARASPNIRNCRAETPLHLACRNGHLQVAEQLLEKGADKDLADANGRTALFRAANIGHEAIVRMLLELRADVDKADTDGWTPLYETACGGSSQCALLLIRARADINRPSSCWATPLHVARQYGNFAIVGLLTNAGARSGGYPSSSDRSCNSAPVG